MVEYYHFLPFEKWIVFVNRNRNNSILLELIERSLAMTLLDYTDMEKEIEDAQEPTTLEVGTEVKARIVSVRTGMDKNDKEYFMPVFEVPDQPMVKEFSDFLYILDKKKLDNKQYQRSLYQFKVFARAFGVDLSRPFDPEDDLVGLEGWVIVGTKKSEEYGEQNTVRKYVAGK